MASEDTKGKDVEGTTQNLPYPKSVFFIIICEFCERFCYYGMRTILTLYFVQVLAWSDDQATVVYHVYVAVSYFTPLLGAMLADSLLGKFQTIFYLGVVYCAGCVVLALSATPTLHFPLVGFSMLGLALIALGTGGIKPCVSAFGADQFKLPEQEIYVASYFAIFYFAINSGSLVSTLLTPVLREDVKCFGDDHCYSLAFAIPGALMIVALIVFVVGRPMYKVNKPEGNVVVQVLGAIFHSLSRKRKEIKAGRKREHWLDYADDKYPKRFLDEAKVLMKVLFLYIPLPLFWALFDQQGSRWTLQATRMDGNTFGWVIKPDQLQVVNPLLVLAFIPIFDRGIYPLLGKFGLIKSPLQRLTVGGIFAGIAFVVSGLVELSLEATYATELKAGESNFHLINGVPCPVFVTLEGRRETLEIDERLIYKAINSKNYSVEFEVDKSIAGCEGYNSKLTANMEGQSKNATSFILMPDKFDRGSIMNLITVREPDDMEKSDSGNPRIRVIYAGMENMGEATLQGDSEKNLFDFHLRPNLEYTEFAEVEPTDYLLTLTHGKSPEGLQFEKRVDAKLGAVYLLSVLRDPSKPTTNDDQTNYQIGLHEITKANSVHMLLLLPQYIIMTAGEIMFSITIMDFSYAEGPPSMKSVMQSAWLMTVAFGNVIVVIVAELKIFDKQWKEFFLFAGLMFVDMAIFAFMAYKYEPTDRFWLNDNQKGEKKDKEEEGENTIVQGNDNAALETNEHND